MNFRLLTALFGIVIFAAGCAAPQISDAPAPQNLPTASQGGVTQSPTTTEVYLLGQGDQIAIQVFDEPDLTLDTLVGASGSINYSYLGDVRVAGKSTVQLEQHITTLLKDGYLVNPSVNVTVLRYRPFYINGEIRAPGSYPYEPGLTLDRAIALAGGLTERASARKIFVSKEGADPADEIRVQLNFRVQPGDTITIKEGFF